MWANHHLINCLAGRHIAKTGDEPAITKGQQRINLRNGIMLLDTPGILWPKIENPQGSYRLATTGAIKDTAVSYEDIAFFAAEFLLEKYPQRLKERFNISDLPQTEIDLLEIIGAQRGCLRSRRPRRFRAGIHHLCQRTARRYSGAAGL